MILGVFYAQTGFANIIIMADQSCRATIEKPDENNHDSSKLSVRSDAKSSKSWIRFDMNDLDVTNLEQATLTVTLHQEKAGNRHFDVSYVNDNILDNIDWDDRSLTWNNAPGNNAADLEGLDAGKTTFLGTVDFVDGVPGDAFTIDVLEALETDTDGIVQFILHNSNGLTTFSTHDHGEEAWRPFIDVNEGSRALAKRPYPASGTTDVSRTQVLSWKPGAYVEGSSPMHKVFLSQDFDEVYNGIGGVTQDASEFSVSGGPLGFGQTYYWRVDEANSVSGWDEGPIWEFTTEPIAYPIPGDSITVTASSFDRADTPPDNTINGSGLNPETGTHSTADPDMWVSSMDQDPNEPVSITFEFDQIVRLHEMKVWNSNLSVEKVLGYGFKDVIITFSTDGTEWTRLGGEEGSSQFDQAPGTSEYSGQLISLDNASAQYVKLTGISNWSSIFDQYSLSEVQFSAIPMAARSPQPESGADQVDPRSAVLSWRSGRDAGQHDVFISTDPDALGSSQTVMDNSLALNTQDLSLDTTYYWQVNEVNETLAPSTWAGDLWNFTTMSSIVVDDFESYGNLSPNRPFQTWIDGYGYSADDHFPVAHSGNNTGSGVGHDIWSLSSDHYNGSIMETGSTMPGSGQSMPVYYDNSGANVTSSQVDYTVGGQDWTVYGLATLSIAVRGTEGNTGTLYAMINNTKISSDPASDIALEEWQVWRIDLTSVNGVSNVQTLAIGIDGANASGVIYLDDIELLASPAN